MPLNRLLVSKKCCRHIDDGVDAIDIKEKCQQEGIPVPAGIFHYLAEN